MTLVKFNDGKSKGSLLRPGFDDVFESILNDSFLTDRMVSRVPAVNISETDGHYHIELAAPGLKKEDFKVSLDRDIFTISAEHQTEESENDKKYNKREFITSNYRPFCKQNLYFDSVLNARHYQNKKLFPYPGAQNVIICVSSVGANSGLSLLIADNIVNFHFNGDTQCFPLYYYEETSRRSPGLFDVNDGSEYIRRDGVSDFILNRVRGNYGKTINREDIFYYVIRTFT